MLEIFKKKYLKKEGGNAIISFLFFSASDEFFLPSMFSDF